MKISVLCSDPEHPVNGYLRQWIVAQENLHDVSLVRCKKDLVGGDILFLISCSELINKSVRDKYTSCLVLHASDLPKGRGWSPHIWQILDGAENITLSLLEAEDAVDSGRIWKKKVIPISKHMLWDEINHMLFNAEIEMLTYAVQCFNDVCPLEQNHDTEASYYRRRKPSDSKIDPNKSIADQFDQIRVSDPNRFPAFFDLRGRRFKVTLEKMDEERNNDSG